MDKIYADFHKWVKFKKTKYGWEANCKKGLFGVTAPTKEIAENEAKHYFIQYWADGEYIEDPEERKREFLIRHAAMILDQPVE